MGLDITEVLASFRAYAEPTDGRGGSPFRLGCSLAGPATDGEIRSAWPTAPPAELARAWSVSRESRLFEDVDYGQWGLALLSPAASAMWTTEQKASRAADYRPGDVVVGEFLGDSDLLVMAPSEPGDYGILVALPLDKRHEWYPVASSLAQFLERYRDNCGEKFWEPHS